jgi:hypothetical protein
LKQFNGAILIISQHMSLNTAFDILDFAKAFLNEQGGILIDSSIRSHKEGSRKSIPEDIKALGQDGKQITFDDISDFFSKVQTEVEEFEKDGTYWFEGVAFENYRGRPLENGVKAKLIWGT